MKQKSKDLVNKFFNVKRKPIYLYNLQNLSWFGDGKQSETKPGTKHLTGSAQTPLCKSITIIWLFH